MNAEKKALGSIIQLNNGSNYEVVENITLIRTLMDDEFINDDSFISFHFPDGYICYIRKTKYQHFMKMKSRSDTAFYIVRNDV